MTTRKDIKTLTVEGHEFLYVVNENGKNHVKLRIYSGKFKTSFVEVHFTWKDNWLINLYKPSVCAKLTKYVLNKGWKHTEAKQTMTISLPQSSLLIKELNLSDLSEHIHSK